MKRMITIQDATGDIIYKLTSAELADAIDNSGFLDVVQDTGTNPFGAVAALLINPNAFDAMMAGDGEAAFDFFWDGQIKGFDEFGISFDVGSAFLGAPASDLLEGMFGPLQATGDEDVVIDIQGEPTTIEEKEPGGTITICGREVPGKTDQPGDIIIICGRPEPKGENDPVEPKTELTSSQLFAEDMDGFEFATSKGVTDGDFNVISMSNQESIKDAFDENDTGDHALVQPDMIESDVFLL